MSGGPMPYVMDKGPYFSVLEDRMATAARRTQMLLDLRNNVDLSSLVGLNSTSLVGDGKQVGQRVAVLNTLWFGMKLTGNRWVPQPNAFPTGHWQGYQGDPEKILRRTLIRAIEVSLGVDYGANPAGATRLWPIDIVWVCQGPFFQGWVMWLEAPGAATGGQVTITLTTPAAAGLPVDARITRDDAAAAKPRYKSPPDANDWAASRGMWVVGHEDYDKRVVYSTLQSTIGRITVPRIEWRRKNTEVICVAPAEWEGGVLQNGRPYTPGT